MSGCPTRSEASYFDALKVLAAGRLVESPSGQRARLTEDFFVAAEPENPHDPDAIVVISPAVGTVGYFSRDDAKEYRALRKVLLKENAIGTCQGRLTGGWEEDINIGVRLSIKGPDAFSGAAVVVPRLTCPDSMWLSRPRVAMPPGRKFGLNLIDEDLCLDALRKAVGDRDPLRETIVIDLLLVPGEPVVLGSPDHGLIGRLSKSDAARYAEVITKMVASGVVGACEGWVFVDDGELEVRISLQGPKRIMPELDASLRTIFNASR